ncbi:MAG: formimidoylglutamase [Flavobacteriaceae bacterium]|nr:formimidoylglutamase [Flavobacteriaceae bacterium]
MNNINQYYRSPDKSLWKGPLSNIDSPNQYWHECIQLHLDGLKNFNSKNLNSDIGLLGYASDEGVRRNNGRQGAINGPKAVREQLGKLPVRFSEKKVTDYGDVLCSENNMEVTQNVFSDIVKEIIESGQLSIGIGGGHDLAYGHFCGIQKALHKENISKIGILNFDAHFDLRTPLKNANSGTPFYQILDEFGSLVKYLVLGIQKSSNSDMLYKNASDFGVNYIPIEECTLTNIMTVFKIIDDYFKDCDYLYVSVDLDGFASSIAPGVSAPGPFGFSIDFFMLVFEYLLKTKNIIAIDVVELNPNYDIDSTTAKLAAQIIDIAVTK